MDFLKFLDPSVKKLTTKWTVTMKHSNFLVLVRNSKYEYVWECMSLYEFVRGNHVKDLAMGYVVNFSASKSLEMASILEMEQKCHIATADPF